MRRQAAVDGQLIDPWHLAAVLQGLRLRMDGALRIIDRGDILDAARHALMLHQWIVAPDFDEEGDVQQAEKHLAGVAARRHPAARRRPRRACLAGLRRDAPADPRRAGPLLDAPQNPPGGRAAHRGGGAARRDVV